MTVQTAHAKVTGVGNGAAFVFPFSQIKIFTSADLRVTHVDTATGIETPLTEGTGATNYSVSVSKYPGVGSVIYPADEVTPMPTGENIVIKRVLTLVQLTNLQNQKNYFADVQETAFDYLTMLCIQQQEELDRGLKAPVSVSSDVAFEVPLPVANAVLGIWNATADAIVEGPTADQVSSAQSYAVAAGLSAVAAAISEAAAAASYDSFDDRYLGVKTSDPTLDNDGDALLDGAIYFNTTVNTMKAYDLGNTTWLAWNDAAGVAYDQGGTGSVATTVETKLREFISVLDFGAVGDGVTDDTAAIQAAIDAAYASNTRSASVFFPPTSDFYLYTSDITVKRNVELVGYGTYYQPNLGTTSTTATIVMQSASGLNGVCTHCTTGLFTGDMITLGDGVFPTNQFGSISFNKVTLINNLNSGAVSLGTGIAMNPDDSSFPVTWTRGHDISFFGFAVGISGVPTNSSWVNSNTFTGLKFWNCERTLLLDDTNGAGVDGNYFQGMSQSKAAHSTSAIDIIGGFNTCEILVWDWSDAFTVPWLHVGPAALGNSFPRYASPENIQDEGEGTIFGASVNSRMAVGNQPIIPAGFRIGGINYEDNDLIGADSKFSVTISTAPDSNASAMFSRSNTAATTWNALSSTPVTIDIDLSGHPDWDTAGSGLMGLGLVGDAMPEVVILSAQLQSGGWVVLETLNFAVNHAVYLDAGLINGGPYNKLRFTMTNATAPAVVRIDSVFARFENSTQGAYLPAIGGTVYGDVALEGITTSSAQPAFLATNTTTDAGVTGNGTSYTVIFNDDSTLDQDSNFNTSTGVFTARVAGTYLFTTVTQVSSVTAAADRSEIKIDTSNLLYADRHDNTDKIGTNILSLKHQCIAYMDANDTASVAVEITGEGADTVAVVGDATGTTFFSGVLLN